MSASNISSQTLKRLPLYLTYLKSIASTSESVSATAIANALSLNDVQVRKDLATVSSSGKPKTGYTTVNLIKDIESFLGYDNSDNAVLIGVGKLGRALLNYGGFTEYGLNIMFAFDADETLTDNQQILPMCKLKEMCLRTHIRIGIITVPAEAAQAVCDMLVDIGIKAIWNFAPVHLAVPDGVLVQNENMASSLALLSRHLKERMKSTD